MLRMRKTGRSGTPVGRDQYGTCVSKSPIDLEDALRYHAGWSEETRALVRSELTRIAAATFVADVHGYWNSVKVYDASGETIADILKTKIWYSPSVAPATTDGTNSWGWLCVSFDGVARARRTSGPTVAEPVPCPSCNMVHAGDECW